MKNDLIERYLYAVTKRLRPRLREDVKKELSGLIDEMLLERCGPVTPTEKDIRVVLTELGSPRELWEKYDDTSGKCLLPQPYYSMWLTVVKIVLLCVVFGLTLSSGILHFTEEQQWYETVLSWLAMVWSGGLQSFAIVTILFLFFSRRGIRLDEPYNFDDLPPVPQRKKISRGECWAGIVFCMVFMVWFLCFPEYIFIHWGPEGVISLFDAAALREAWYLILGIGLLGIVREVILLREGQYTQRVMVATVALNSAFAVIAVIWLGAKTRVSAQGSAWLQQMFQEESAFMYGFFGNFQYVLLGIFLFAAVLDTAETVYKTLKEG